MSDPAPKSETKTKPIKAPLACPVCRSAPVIEHARQGGALYHWVDCGNSECGLSGPLKPTFNDAVRTWNRLRLA